MLQTDPFGQGEGLDRPLVGGSGIGAGLFVPNFGGTVI